MPVLSALAVSRGVGAVDWKKLGALGRGVERSVTRGLYAASPYGGTPKRVPPYGLSCNEQRGINPDPEGSGTMKISGIHC